MCYSHWFCRKSCHANENVIFYSCFQCEALNS
nr:MAG TPA: Big defensin [Caudoviricetes sp.]